MVIEGIKSSGVAYQGSTSGPESVTETDKTASAATSADVSDKQTDAPAAQENALSGEDEAVIVGCGTEAMKKAVDEINKNAKNSEAIFGIHDATNRVTIKIVDKDTKKVIKEYPPEKTLDMIVKVWEMGGLMVDEKR